MAGGGIVEKSLNETPTWAVATVCTFFVVISILIEHGIHSLGKWFQKRHKKAMMEALEKVKAELMILGFISLLLTVGTTYIVKICIPAELEDSWLPCEKSKNYNYQKGEGGDGDNEGNPGEHDRRRKLLYYAQDLLSRRVLAGAYEKDYCASKGKVSIISYSGLHQLHIFIFVLAIFHVLYSIVIIGLGQAKLKKWKAWELETSSLEYELTNHPSRFRFAHQTSFVRRHAGFSTRPGVRWIVAFFRQFLGSISKVDYLTIRNGFINAHFAPNAKFDFHKYIKRSMEDDFKSVLGISIPLWIFAVIFLLLNVYEWHTLTWISLFPLIIIMLVGTKLELVIMEMAQQIQDRTTVVRGAPLVEPSNNFFWFNRPQWILFLIHFTLFENAFQMAYFLWTMYEFGTRECFHEKLFAVVFRVLLGVALHFLCSYITFPLYALVTQMGSHMKRAIFEEQTAKALKKWHKAAKDRKKQRKAGSAMTPDGSVHSGFMSGETTPSKGSSPIYLLHKYRSNNAPSAAVAEEESVPTSPISYHSDTDLSELEAASNHHHGAQPHNSMMSGDHQQQRIDVESHSVELSFSN